MAAALTAHNDAPQITVETIVAAQTQTGTRQILPGTAGL